MFKLINRALSIFLKKILKEEIRCYVMFGGIINEFFSRFHKIYFYNDHQFHKQFLRLIQINVNLRYLASIFSFTLD